MIARNSTDMPMPVVVLGVRSQDEEPGKDSAGDQVRVTLERALQEPGRFEYATHTDHGSGYRGNRGDGTQAALDDAKRAADEYGQAELWLFKSERVARGSGRKDEARSVLEVFAEMRRAGVDLRSFADDEYFTNPMLVGVADAMAHKYTEDLSSHVLRGLNALAEAGEWAGGIPPDGFMVLREYDDRGKVVKRQLVKDPERRAIYDLHWELALAGYSAESISLEFDRRGYLTQPYKRNFKKSAPQKPRAFDANIIGQRLNNPAYAGLRVHRGEVVGPGNWDAYVRNALTVRTVAAPAGPDARRRGTCWPAWRPTVTTLAWTS
jgi:DNA invertase Pin-like site-specific DNA recombinase